MGNEYKCGIYVTLITIDLRIHTKLLCGGGGRIESESKMLGSDQSDTVVACLNPCAILIQNLLVT